MNFNINSIFSENTKNSINIFLNKHKLAMNQNDTTLFTCQLAMIRNHFQGKVDECESIINTRVFTKEEYRKAVLLNDRLDKFGDRTLQNVVKAIPDKSPGWLPAYKEYAKKHFFRPQYSYGLRGFLLFCFVFPITLSLAINVVLLSENIPFISLGNVAKAVICGIGAIVPLFIVFLNERYGLYAMRRKKILDYVYDVEVNKHNENVKYSRNMLPGYKAIVNELETFLDKCAAQEKDAIPRAYWTDANTIYDLVFNKRADSLKEAINLTETLKHQQRLEETQQRSVMISQAAYDAALNAQADARNAQLAAEEAAREANAAARSADHANDFIAWM